MKCKKKKLNSKYETKVTVLTSKSFSHSFNRFVQTTNLSKKKQVTVFMNRSIDSFKKFGFIL